jgi:hypothetical protein
MISYRSGDVVGARSILGCYLAGVLSIRELALIAAPLAAGRARGGRGKPIPNHNRRFVDQRLRDARVTGQDKEDLLAAAGFSVQLANMPQRAASLGASPANKFIPEAKSGGLRWIYADPIGERRIDRRRDSRGYPYAPPNDQRPAGSARARWEQRKGMTCLQQAGRISLSVQT